MTAPDAGQPRVLVAFPTFRRSELLPALVESIRADASTVDAMVRILAVDNDPAASAADAARALGIEHHHEVVPGIAAARQAALDAAAPGELLAMIDDDVVPEPGWLAGLLRTRRASGASIVSGYVRYVWPQDTDPWIAAGGFMRRDRHPEGAELSTLSTGNVLLDVDQLRALGVRFDISLGLTGGEDSQFGRDVLAAGGSIVASADSVVRDDVPRARTTREFVRRRTIAQGQGLVRLCSRDALAHRRLAKRALHLAGGVGRLVAFSAGAGWARARRDVASHAVLQRRSWFAWGRVLGAVGHHDEAYGRDPLPDAR